MADIGSTLRETRIRDKIDITVVEEATKIRAKYLRALENEEWAVLPGPTFVKSFLRTYAEFLGLDAHMLVEEYRVRYEHPEDLELPAFAESRPLRGRVRPPGPPSRAVAAVGIAVVVLVVLFVLGLTAGDENNDTGAGTGNADKATKPSRSASGHSDQGTTSGGAPAGATGTKRSEARPVRVSVVASRTVWVCLVDSKGELVIGGRTLTGGQTEGPFRSKRFRLTVGNGGADLRIDGRARNLPETSEPQGYAISSKGLRDLAASKRPTCAPGTSSSSGSGA
jgi:cytoskeleton protein RodZ